MEMNQDWMLTVDLCLVNDHAIVIRRLQFNEWIYELLSWCWKASQHHDDEPRTRARIQDMGQALAEEGWHEMKKEGDERDSIFFLSSSSRVCFFFKGVRGRSSSFLTLASTARIYSFLPRFVTRLFCFCSLSLPSSWVLILADLRPRGKDEKRTTREIWGPHFIRENGKQILTARPLTETASFFYFLVARTICTECPRIFRKLQAWFTPPLYEKNL